MAGIIALLPVLLQLIEQGVALAPELIAEVKAFIADLNPNTPALTPAQEATLFAITEKLVAQAEAGA